MHTQRLTKLAEWLEAGAKHERISFDMATGIAFVEEDDTPSADRIPECKTSCCIAGAAVQFFGSARNLARTGARLRGTNELDWHRVSERAQSLLKLDDADARRLFKPNEAPFHGEYRSLRHFNDPYWAARTIRHFIATGVIDWEATEMPG